MKKRTVAVIGALAILCAGWVQSADFGTWGQKMKITFGGYNKSETLTNFPVLVSLGTNLTGFSYSQFSSTSGGDLRFSDSSQTNELNCEVEKWNTGGTSYVWVQVPGISSTNTRIWAFWKNANQTSAPAYTTNGATWAAGFGGVWHMNETVGNGGTQHDSTANHNSGTFYAASSSTGGLAALVGNGDWIYGGSGSGQRLQVSDNASIRNGSNLTMGVWLKCADSTWYQESGCPMSKRGGYMLYPSPSGGKDIRFRFSDGNNNKDTPTYTVGNITQWHYYVGRYDKAAQKEILFFDGQPVATNTVNATIVNGSELTWGCQPNDGPAQYRGWVDESRVETVTRSDNWIWANYMTIASNSVFSSYGQVGLQLPLGPILRLK
jgi:hypothetical protein